MAWTWYLALDTQFFIISPFIIIIIYKHFKTGLFISIGIMIASYITQIIIMFKMNISSS